MRRSSVYQVCRGLILAGAMQAVVAGAQPARAVVKTWSNAAGGAWSAAANWNPFGVPAAADDVVIDLIGTYTVTLSGSATVNSLTLGAAVGQQTLSVAANLTLSTASTVGAHGILLFQSGTLGGAGNLTIDGAFQWNGGTHSGTGLTTVNNGIAVGGTLPKVLTARQMSTAGVSLWAGTASLTIGSGAAITNNGVWSITGDATMQVSGGAPSAIAVSAVRRRRSAMSSVRCSGTRRAESTGVTGDSISTAASAVSPPWSTT